jgi:hypothetical protein
MSDVESNTAATEQRDVYRRVTDAIINAIEQGQRRSRWRTTL